MSAFFRAAAFLAALFGVALPLTACGGEDPSDSSSPTHPGLSAPPSVGQDAAAASDEPCLKCKADEVCDSTGNVEKCASRPVTDPTPVEPPPMSDPANPCFGVRELEGNWHRSGTDERAEGCGLANVTDCRMTVTCQPDMSQRTCVITFSGRGSIIDGATVRDTDLPVVAEEPMQNGMFRIEVYLDGDSMVQVVDDPDGNGGDTVLVRE